MLYGLEEIIIIRKELITALRGKQTQAHLSKKLGYTFNIVNRWERGMSCPTWEEFSNLCSLRGHDVNKLCGSIGISLSSAGSTSLVQFLLKDQNIASVSKATDISAFKLKKWTSGEASPDLDAILQLVDLSIAALPEFIEVIVSPSEHSLKSTCLRRHRLRLLFQEYPWAAVAMHCLQLKEYQEQDHHPPSFIARKLQLEITNEIEVLEKLCEVEVITRVGQKFAVVETSMNVLRLGSLGQKMAKFWSSETFRRVDSASIRFQTFTCSKVALQKLKELQEQFIKDTTLILKTDDLPEEEVGLLISQYLPLTEPKKSFSQH